MIQLNPYAGRFMGRAGAIGTPLRGGLQRGLLSCHFGPFCLAVILASALVSHSANMPQENKRQRGPGRRGGGLHEKQLLPASCGLMAVLSNASRLALL